MNSLEQVISDFKQLKLSSRDVCGMVVRVVQRETCEGVVGQSYTREAHHMTMVSSESTTSIEYKASVIKSNSQNEVKQSIACVVHLASAASASSLATPGASIAPTQRSSARTAGTIGIATPKVKHCKVNGHAATSYPLQKNQTSQGGGVCSSRRRNLG